MSKLIVANWKMSQGLKASQKLAVKYAALAEQSQQNLVVCPSVFALTAVGKILQDSGCALGAQDVSFAGPGAYTGEVAATALAEAGLKINRRLIIAYEPVWAVGSGKVMLPAEVKSIHRFIRQTIAKILGPKIKLLILYGGSVKPDNAQALLDLSELDGLLVGSASWQTSSFVKIAKIKVKSLA